MSGRQMSGTFRPSLGHKFLPSLLSLSKQYHTSGNVHENTWEPPIPPDISDPNKSQAPPMRICNWSNLQKRNLIPNWWFFPCSSLTLGVLSSDDSAPASSTLSNDFLWKHNKTAVCCDVVLKGTWEKPLNTVLSDNRSSLLELATCAPETHSLQNRELSDSTEIHPHIVRQV